MKSVFQKKIRQNGEPSCLFVPQAMLAQSCKKTFTCLSNNQILQILTKQAISIFFRKGFHVLHVRPVFTTHGKIFQPFVVIDVYI